MSLEVTVEEGLQDYLAENRVKSPVGTRAQANPLKIEGIKADGKDQGTPTYWRVTASSNGRDLRLVAVQVELRQRTLAFSGLLGMICLIAWLVTY